MNQEQKADKWTDKELARLETRIRAQYEQAEREISAKANAYFAKYQKRWERENLALETTRHTKEEIEDMWYNLYGNTAGFEIWYKTADHAYGKTWQEAKAAFARWEYAQLGRGDDWIELQAQMSQRLTQSTQIAAGYINGILPKVYAEANNAIATLATQSAMNQGVMGVRFDLVDEYTVRFLMESSSEVRPYKPVVISLEQTTRWSKNKLQNALLQGILQGDSIGKIAERFSAATGMSRSMAIRNARTAVTGARSKGKQDRYEELESKGAFVTKVWVATEDDRTRPEHAQADGQEVDTNSAFDVGGEELMYPADPSGSPWNIVNCRCTMQTGEIRFKSTLSDEQRENANIRIVGEPEAEETQEQQEQEIQEPKKEGKTLEEIAQGTKEALTESTDYHIDKNGLNLVKASEGDYIQVDYSRIDVRSAQAFDYAISNLCQEYDTPLTTVRTMTAEEAFGSSKVYARVFHDYELDNATMLINPVMFRDYDKYISRMQENWERGWFSNIDSENLGRYVATHEFAHTLINMGENLNNRRNWANADYDRIRRTRKDIQSVYDSYLESIRPLQEKAKKLESMAILEPDESVFEEARKAQELLRKAKVSEYSMSSADEFMAECFALEKLGTGNEWSRLIMEIIDREYRR